MAMAQALPPSSKGFTLIELLIVMAIIGILAVISLPQYQSYQVRSQAAAALAEASALRPPIEAALLEAGPVAVASAETVSLEVPGDGSAVITAERALREVILTRGVGAGWICEHTFETQLPGCSAFEVDSIPPGNSNGGGVGDGDENPGNVEENDEPGVGKGGGRPNDLAWCQNAPPGGGARDLCATNFPENTFDWP